MNLFALPTLGVVVTLFIGLYFLLFGNKKDPVSWLSAIAVIVLILVISYWSSISHVFSGSAAAAAPAPSQPAVHAVHATPTTPPAAHPKVTAQREDAVVQPASSLTNPFTTFLSALAYSAGATCLGAIIVVGLILARTSKR